MKAYLETVVVTRNPGVGGGIEATSTSVSQVVLEFEDWTQWQSFNASFDAHEKAPGFEIFRTLLPLW